MISKNDNINLLFRYRVQAFYCQVRFFFFRHVRPFHIRIAIIFHKYKDRICIYSNYNFSNFNIFPRWPNNNYVRSRWVFFLSRYIRPLHIRIEIIFHIVEFEFAIDYFSPLFSMLKSSKFKFDDCKRIG